MPDFAEASDVAARWRPLSTQELSIATTLLTDVSAMLRKDVPALDQLIAAGAVNAELVKLAACQIVIRAMSSQPGVRTDSQTVGPFSRTVSYDTAQQGLQVTDEDLALFLPRTSKSRVVGTINVRPARTPQLRALDAERILRQC